MKYKEGDVIRLRHDLKAGKRYGSYWCEQEMEDMKGRSVRITGVRDGLGTYRLDGYEEPYFTDEMIAGLEIDILRSEAKAFKQTEKLY